jgi:hypothetical protein
MQSHKNIYISLGTREKDSPLRISEWSSEWITVTWDQVILLDSRDRKVKRGTSEDTLNLMCLRNRSRIFNSIAVLTLVIHQQID